MDERGRRIFAATEARTAGFGGIAAVSRATGIAASTIGRGLAELSAADPLTPGRVRRPGGGDRTLVAKDPTLLADLLALVEPDTNPRNGRLFRPFRGLVSRAGLAGGRAQNKDSYRPALTHTSWVNSYAGWY